MGLSRFFHCLRRSAMVTLIGMTCACQPSDTGDAPTSSKAPQTAVPVRMDAPTLAELGNATYLGIDEEPVTLVDGEWQGEPFIEGGASRPRAGLVRDFHLSGDLNGDGVKESVALLWTNAGGSGTFDYIAVVGRDNNATPINLATADLGDRVNVRAAGIDAGLSLMSCRPVRMIPPAVRDRK